MPRARRADYWENREGRAKAGRGHEDDLKHRLEMRDLLRDAWRATGLRGKHWSFDSYDRQDWKASSVQRWAKTAHMSVRFVFEGLEVPDEFAARPEGETDEEQRQRVKRAIRAIRLGQKVNTLEMDRRLDQQYCAYHAWEKRMTDFQLAAMQRAVRALGGVFRVEFVHDHNPGIMLRLNKKR